MRTPPIRIPNTNTLYASSLKQYSALCILMDACFVKEHTAAMHGHRTPSWFLASRNHLPRNCINNADNYMNRSSLDNYLSLQTRGANGTECGFIFSTINIIFLIARVIKPNKTRKNNLATITSVPKENKTSWSDVTIWRTWWQRIFDNRILRDTRKQWTS